MNSQSNIRECKGIGEKNGALFHKLNIDTIQDLLNYAPASYELFEAPDSTLELHDAEVNVSVLTYLKDVSKPQRIRGIVLTKAIFETENNEKIYVTIFNMPYISKSLNRGEQYILKGILENKNRNFSMKQPKIYPKNKYEELMKSYMPIYSLTKGLTQNVLRKTIAYALENTHVLPETLPNSILLKNKLIGNMDMYQKLHFPKSNLDIREVKERLSYEEFFYYYFPIYQNQLNIKTTTTTNIYSPSEFETKIIDTLPFKLTSSQELVWSEILKDVCCGTICNRLIQGDVGSGKTILAILSLLISAGNGKQSALMAPTEVLARQHYELLKNMLEKNQFNIPIAFLSGSTKKKEKSEIYKALLDGTLLIVVGTHALLEDVVEFKCLGLIVADEQHRFGVKQRRKLQDKGIDVHSIVMSATPIPRSLAMILYGGMDVSQLLEKPANRLPIKNCVVSPSYRKTAYDFIHKQIEMGRQAYVICPFVETNEECDIESVTDYSVKLKKEFPSTIRIAMLHGRMKNEEKISIMNEFALGNIDILVSTTVIEVGIDVKNASVILIENSERFGLATLHQIRGRVGRGIEQSYCIMVTSATNQKTQERLSIVSNTNDGFKIAEEDLKLRGPGEMNNVMQSGEFGFAHMDILSDHAVMKNVKRDIVELFETKESDFTDEDYRMIQRVMNCNENHKYMSTI